MGMEKVNFPSAVNPERIKANGFEITLKAAPNPEYSEVTLYRDGASFDTVVLKATGEIVDNIQASAPREQLQTARRLKDQIPGAIMTALGFSKGTAGVDGEFWSTPEATRNAQAAALAKQRGDHRPDVQ